MKQAYGDKHVERFIQQHALPGEEVRNWVKARRDSDALEGRLITTQARLVYYRNGMMSEKIEVWSLDKVSSVECKVGMVLTDVKIHTSGDQIKVKILSEKRLAREYVSELQLAINQPAANASPPPLSLPTDVATDPMALLAKLGELRDAGILSDDEFQAKKSELLSRI